ncbi:CD209 antigen-like protein D isoform X2 [Rissa tridactyla]|uniref:CD209 antigen-like protein D isoform X2 n=1 Tax=Rissa tridactyla TaxID=75485 RepID=UPI0023BA80BC|nr:CD209 antigen-like protein D isoform X2 [Rissa tridactyla]
MYGNIESSQAEQGQMWVLGPGDREACSDLCPTEENLYEPLDPAITVPSQKHVSDSPSMAWARAEPSPAGPNHAAVKASAPQFCPSRGSVVTHPPFPASGCRSRDKLVLVGAVALGVSVLVNVVLLTVGSRHVAALTEALEAEKAKELPNMGCSPCPKGWTYWGNSCYFYSKTPSSWDNAQRFCSALGTQLLEVDGTEEKGHIQSMLQGSSWLGISDAEVEGTWKRGNGTILLRQSSSWHRDEPNGGRQENCAAVREDGQWYDYPCTYKLPWVCEGRP